MPSPRDDSWNRLNDPATGFDEQDSYVGLSPQQIAAIRLLAAGKHYSEVAATIDVARRTVNNWRKLPAFIVALNNEMLSLREAAQARLLSLANRAFDALERTLMETENDNARIAAVRLVLERLDVTMPGGAAADESVEQAPTKIVLLDPKKASEELRRRMAEGGK